MKQSIPVAAAEASRVIAWVRQKGVTLWCDGGELRYRAPKGALGCEEIQHLKDLKEPILAHLENEAVTAAKDAPIYSRPDLHTAPVSFSQLQYWNRHRLATRKAMRHMACAVRLRGRLDVEALKRSASEPIRRHQALRAQIVLEHGAPQQRISDRGAEVSCEDLSHLPEGKGREIAVRRSIEGLILEPVDPARDPLLAIRLLKVRDDEHVLILAMEHLIADAVSRAIVTGEILTGYSQTAAGVPISLPEVRVQFPDYAYWQRKTQEADLHARGARLMERLQGVERLRFPRGTRGTLEGAGLAEVPVFIAREQRARLERWARENRTTLVLSALTAYVATVLKWCQVSETVVLYQTNGRDRADAEGAIGFFAATLYLRIRLSRADSFLDLLKCVTQEYCAAYEQCDFCYVESLSPAPGFTRNTRFNWVPQAAPVFDSETDTGGVIASPVAFANPALGKLEEDIEPTVLLYDSDQEIQGGIHFPAGEFSPDAMRRFGASFLGCLEMLVDHSTSRVGDVPIAPL